MSLINQSNKCHSTPSVGLVTLTETNTNPRSCWSSAKPNATNSWAPNWARRLNNFLAMKLNLNDKSGLLLTVHIYKYCFCQFEHVGCFTLDKMSLLIQEQHRLNSVDNEMVSSYEEEISKTPRVQEMYRTWLFELGKCSHSVFICNGIK